MTDPITQIFSTLVLIAIFILVVGIIIGGVISLSRKSKKYRKYLTDMYVSARIRELALVDKLDINKEEANYEAWCKNDKAERNGLSLDNSIEEELIEKVNTRKEEKKSK